MIDGPAGGVAAIGDGDGVAGIGVGDDVGLVVVSHSRALARAAVAMAAEMLQGRPVRIEVAAGLDEETLGTDAVAILAAVERADGPAGVVVLMDLGSAVLSAEMALELAGDPSLRERVTLSAAPVVEGLIVAAVAAAGGASRAEVAAEASDALLGKLAHLGIPAEGTTADTVTGETGTGQTESGEIGTVSAETVGEFSVENAHGLHARPAARLVGEVRGLAATVHLRNLTSGAGPVPAASLSQVATLAALRGHEVEVRASGPQRKEAVERILALAARRFDEPVEPAAGPQAPAVTAPQAPAVTASPSGSVTASPSVPLPEPLSATRSGPLPGAPGIAVGRLRRLSTVPVDLDHPATGDPAQEWQRIEESIAATRCDIEQLRDRTTREVGAGEAGIFDAHLALLADDEILHAVKARTETGIGAAAAWAGCLAEVERRFAGLPDPYLRERAADVHAVSDQVLARLTGQTPRQVTAPGVLVASDLTPAEAAGLDVDLVTGVVLASGSATSHAAVLARARDLPLVVGAGGDVLTVPEGTTIVLDGSTGEVHFDPLPEVLAEFRRRAADLAERRGQHQARAGEPAVTLDGTRILVAANVGSVAEARSSMAAGADGVGLVRTEFLFLGRSTAPDRDEQQADYEAIAEAMAGRRVTVRTLDVGGDKPLPYLAMPVEANPFLGRRGIRLSLEHRDMLRDQLIAVCRTARRFPISVMYPMVSTVGELLEARRVLTDAAGPSGIPAGLKVGMMVEVPAAALRIETFLAHLDFVSIGTNDLTQYTLAAERGNGAVAALSDALDPAILVLVDRVCRAARGRVDVAVCGEAAADELAIPVLVGLGIRELSVSPSAVPRVKAAVRELDVARCATLARQACSVAGPGEVRKLVLAMRAESTG